MKPLPPDAALRLAAIVESSDDAILSKDLDGTITSWNRGAERLFGFTAEEALGRSITLIVPEERMADEDDVLARIRRGERVDHRDTARRRKDGAVVDVSLTVSPIRDAAGRIIGASSIARDITERRRIDAELRVSQQRLMGLAVASASVAGSSSVDDVLSSAIGLARDIFQADGYALWRSDAQGIWRVARAYGVSEAFAAAAITAPADRHTSAPVPFVEPFVCTDVSESALLVDRLEAYQTEGIRSLIAFPLLVRGEPRATMVFYARRATVYGELDLRVGTALANLVAASLTHAELHEEQQRAREEADRARQQAVFLAEAGAALDASLDYASTLKTVARLAVPTIADWCAVDIVAEGGVLEQLAVAHVDPEKVALAQRLRERYPPDPSEPRGAYEVLQTSQPAMMARIPQALVDQTARDDEHRQLLRALRLTSYMCVPILIRGKVFGVMTFVSSESGREYGEDDLRLARELAARASLAIENARAYARAVEASRSKDEFLAVLSHELRTPLNAVLGYTRLLRSGRLEAERAAEALEVVERNARALQQIIEDVLDVSRIVAGRLRLNLGVVDLPSVLREACDTVLPAAHARGVHLETEIDWLVPPMSGDADRLQQVVWNLLSNAIKFTPRDGQVWLALARVGSQVRIVVRDSGRGIAPEFLPYIFERFRQADASFSREHGGLGLGLAIARQLTELHGGTITASSEGPGRGTTMTVTLPILSVRGSPAALELHASGATTVAADESDASPRLTGMTVLAIDDEADSLELLRVVLDGVGARVVTASSGRDALDTIEATQPDVLVADVGMPGMDGLELIGRIRALDAPVRDTPAIALTAYARAQDRAASLASGFQTHLVKPIEPRELIRAVAALAARRSHA